MKRLARFSSSAHSLYCGLWVPRSRAEPFFPLCPSWSTGTIQPQDAAPVPPSGIAGFASSGIIPGRLPHSDKPSPGFFFDNSPVVLFVELHIYNTVVLYPLKAPVSLQYSMNKEVICGGKLSPYPIICRQHSPFPPLLHTSLKDT